MTTVDVVVPDGIDDPARPSGGNAYDRHICAGLTSYGWTVREHAVPGTWPRPDADSLTALDRALRGLPDGALVLADGLVASTAPEVLRRQAGRLRLVVLVHMPLGHLAAGEGPADARERERAVLSVATAVVATSAWTRRRLLELYGLPAERVHIAEPAVDAADLAVGTETGGALLCVAAVTFNKGHDVLLDALATITELPWRCTCLGSLERDPAFVEGLLGRTAEGGLDGRVSFPGARIAGDLDRAYAAADALVVASRSEAYGMVVLEALARGLPVIATDVGGVSEAVGHGSEGGRPGLLVASDDPAALAGALRAWLGDAQLRERLRRAARERRESLPRWPATTSRVADVLAEVSR